MPLAAFPKCFLDRLIDDRSMTPEEWIDLAGSLDIDGLEFFSEFTPFKDPGRLDRLRKQAADRGLTIPMMCHSPDFTREEANLRQREIERQKIAIEGCARLGGSYCRVLSGQRRPGVTVDDGIRWTADCISDCLPFASVHHVTLILENHYKDGSWIYPEFAQKQAVFLKLVATIGEHENFGINFDPSNSIVAGEDPYELLSQVKHLTRTMHASDRWLEPGSTLDDLHLYEQGDHSGYAPFLHHGIIGRGLIDYDRIFTVLRNEGFTGWISIEDGQDPENGIEHLQLSAEFLRRKMKEYSLP